MSSVSNPVELSAEAQKIKDDCINKAGKQYAYARARLTVAQPDVSEVAA
ncbi:hypothetical protein [Arthrobacter sp. MYb213]|nr:hypothetical protein [Arthrobacter sp. MYb213]